MIMHHGVTKWELKTKTWVQQGLAAHQKAQDNYASFSEWAMMNEAGEVQLTFVLLTYMNGGTCRSYQEQVSAGSRSNSHTAISAQRVVMIMK
jgi:hypothetical protein